MAWTDASSTTDPNWTNDSSTTNPGYSGQTAGVMGWGAMSVVTDATGGVDFQYRAVAHGALRVSAAMPVSISNTTFTRP